MGLDRLGQAGRRLLGRGLDLLDLLGPGGSLLGRQRRSTLQLTHPAAQLTHLQIQPARLVTMVGAGELHIGELLPADGFALVEQHDLLQQLQVAHLEVVKVLLQLAHIGLQLQPLVLELPHLPRREPGGLGQHGLMPALEGQLQRAPVLPGGGGIGGLLQLAKQVPEHLAQYGNQGLLCSGVVVFHDLLHMWLRSPGQVSALQTTVRSWGLGPRNGLAKLRRSTCSGPEIPRHQACRHDPYTKEAP